MITLDNFVFYWKRVTKNHITWNCRNCNSRCKVTLADDAVKECSPHTCTALTNFEMHHLGFRNNIKERSASEDTKYSTIYDQERRKLISESGAGPEEVAKTLKPFSTVVSVMKNIGSKLRPKLPQCLKAIKIVGDWILTFNKLAIFLIYNAVFNRMLVFCSPDGLKCLAASTCWHADGTFYTASKYFYQLYVIQVWYKNRMIPCAWILMNRRTTEDYVSLLNELVKAATANGQVLKPKTIMLDFELAAINAFKQV